VINLQNIKEIIGNNLKYIRFQSGLSQEKFYEKYGLSVKYFSSIERGEVNIGVETLEAISKKFKVPISDLVTFDKQKIIHQKRIDERKRI